MRPPCGISLAMCRRPLPSTASYSSSSASAPSSSSASSTPLLPPQHPLLPAACESFNDSPVAHCNATRSSSLASSSRARDVHAFTFAGVCTDPNGPTPLHNLLPLLERPPPTASAVSSRLLPPPLLLLLFIRLSTLVFIRFFYSSSSASAPSSSSASSTPLHPPQHPRHVLQVFRLILPVVRVLLRASAPRVSICWGGIGGCTFSSEGNNANAIATREGVGSPDDPITGVVVSHQILLSRSPSNWSDHESTCHYV